MKTKKDNKKYIEQQKEFEKVYEYIDTRFRDEFPDLEHPLFTIEKTIKYLGDFIYEQLVQEQVASVFGLGKFSIVSKLNRYGDLQFYPKFRYGVHLVRKIRSTKGTCTVAEKKLLEKKANVNREIWNKRVYYMLKKYGKVTQAFLDYRKRLRLSDDWQSEFKEVLDQLEREKSAKLIKTTID